MKKIKVRLMIKTLFAVTNICKFEINTDFFDQTKIHQFWGFIDIEFKNVYQIVRKANF